MTPDVVVAWAPARVLAAVRRRVALGTTGTAWREPLDRVWAFLRAHPDLRTDGHNVFLYGRPAPGSPTIEVAYGVEIARPFEPVGEVRPVQTPTGEVATIVHVGPYEGLRAAHDAIGRWADATRRALAGPSWEIYGDWADDPSRLSTTIVYLLG